MKQTALLLLGVCLALRGIAQLPAYDTTVYTFIRTPATDSVILEQQQWYKSQTVLLSGKVTDETNQPLQGAIATLGNNQYRTTTDAEGYFSFSLPNQALTQYNVVCVSASGKKTAAQTLHWTAFPTSVSFQLQPITRCGCPPPPDSLRRCCDISITMTVDELFEKEKPQAAKKGMPKQLHQAKRRLKAVRTSGEYK